MSCNIVDTIGDCEKLEKNCKSEESFANVIASELVTEIIENAMDAVDELEAKSSKTVGDILDNLSNKFQELAIGEERPGDGAPAFGVGDHLDGDKRQVGAAPVYGHPPVEKKSRLTDLVKNSKHLWAKLVFNEHKDDARDCKSEKILRVVDLDCNEPPFKAGGPEEPAPLPHAASTVALSSTGGENDSLDEVALSATKERAEDAKKTMTFPLAGSSGKSLMECYRTLKVTADFKKKKWNFGSKLVNYIRKQHAKKQGKGASDGVEITPKAEESS
ncbi:unnamed protein product [Phyllotreta striolata]|uniref:Uncharacterized protein n=1 Tax=Phyllotreta striolata TaxID=444603 RepID=A0A9N9TTF2_PHYSR|nr:unnamed protein product [Phyllotreta striolata]